jgi:hypothetical protein
MDKAEKTAKREERIKAFLGKELGTKFIMHVSFNPTNDGKMLTCQHIHVSNFDYNTEAFWVVKLLVMNMFNQINSHFTNTFGVTPPQPPQKEAPKGDVV